MFSPFFADMFGMNSSAPPQQQQQTTIPPASRKFLDRLKEERITGDDLLEENNKECLVCLEEQKVGGMGVKLPCGHLYHRSCVVDWLNRHCTCPCCRFEVESDDAEYEKERRKRMKTRKLRMRADEISHKSISQLRELCRSLGVSIAGCVDKCEIVDNLIKSGKIDVTEGLPAVEIPRSEFLRKGVGELRHMLLSYGLSDEGALEKGELRSRLEESGRVIIVEDMGEEGKNDATSGYASIRADCDTATTDTATTALSSDSDKPVHMEDVLPAQAAESDRATNSDRQIAPVETESDQNATSTATPAAAYSGMGEGTFALGSDLLRAMSVRELKSILSSYGINSTNCIDRQDLVDLLKADCRFTIVEG